MKTNHNYSIIKADQNTYSRFFATYRKNIWHRPSWSFLQQMMLNASNCYWLYKDNKRVAGISLEENEIGSLFMIPPYSLTVEIVSFLKDFVTDITRGNCSVDAYNVLPEDRKIFEQAGFLVSSTRKCMIRPTEKLASPLNGDYICVKPSQEHFDSIVQLKNEAYNEGPDKQDLEIYQQDIKYYFEHNNQDNLLEASSIIIHKDTNEFVGFCLVSLWEDMPLIYDIGVKPSYNRQGLGKYMLCRAISNIESSYPVIRLFVTAGNSAEYLYSNYGFLSGEEASHLVLKSES